MKKLLLIAFLFLTGCQTMGTALQTVGQGMQSGAQNNRTINCTTTQYGNQYNSQCR